MVLSINELKRVNVEEKEEVRVVRFIDSDGKYAFKFLKVDDE